MFGRNRNGQWMRKDHSGSRSNDYEVAIRCELPMINILRTDGTLNDEAGIYAGLTIPQARPRVVADLDALGQLGEVEDREIELPYSDRSKTPIEPFLADQWFVKMDTLAQSALDAVSDESSKDFSVRYRKGFGLAGREARLAGQSDNCGGDIRFRFGPAK